MTLGVFERKTPLREQRRQQQLRQDECMMNVDEDVGASKPQQVRVTGFTSPAYMDLTSCLLAETQRHRHTQTNDALSQAGCSA